MYIYENDVENPQVDKVINIAPGFHTSIAISRVDTVLLPKPWGFCDAETINYGDKYYGEDAKPFGLYNEKQCLIDCFGRKIIEVCGCHPHFYEPAVKQSSGKFNSERTNSTNPGKPDFSKAGA